MFVVVAADLQQQLSNVQLGEALESGDTAITGGVSSQDAIMIDSDQRQALAITTQHLAGGYMPSAAVQEMQEQPADGQQGATRMFSANLDRHQTEAIQWR